MPLLKSSDKQVFRVSFKAISRSALIKPLLEASGDSNEEIEDNDSLPITDEEMNKQEIIPIQNVTAEILIKVIEWLEHHKNDPEPENEELTEEEEQRKKDNFVISEWDANFMEGIKIKQQTLFDVILVIIRFCMYRSNI